jgi:flagellar motor switch protein FliM
MAGVTTNMILTEAHLYYETEQQWLSTICRKIANLYAEAGNATKAFRFTSTALQSFPAETAISQAVAMLIRMQNRIGCAVPV